MPNNGFYGSPSLTQFAFFISLITIVFFQGFAGQDNGRIAHLFNPTIASVADRCYWLVLSHRVGFLHHVGFSYD